MRPGLAERKVATQDGESRGAKRIPQRCEKQRATVCSSAVRQDQAVCPWKGSAVQESLNRRTAVSCVDKYIKVLHSYSRAGTSGQHRRIKSSLTAL